MNAGMLRDILISFILAGALLFLLKLPWILAVVLGATFFFSIRATHRFQAKIQAENEAKAREKDKQVKKK